MKIGEYVQEYTSGNRTQFVRIFSEVKEFIVEIIKFKPKTINEEFQDVLHFIQLWLYWRFGLNGEIWKITSDSIKKFKARRVVWRDIYEHVGLSRYVSNQCSNYMKEDKVVSILSKYNIPESKAIEAYKKIVTKK